MNVLRFLTPKSNVAYIYDDFTLRQTLEKMEFHRYSAIPIINRAGEYVGTLTEGDLLWAIKNQYSLNLKEAENVPITQVPRRMDNEPVTADTSMEELISVALNQNFVPVIDDRGVFIGIVTRKEIMRYFQEVARPRVERALRKELAAASRIGI
ncbi:MAG TPA: CBS domain-containing protein [Candidatus Ventrousia excrementavium]|uniref:CBS domain-containing protein n=1 Tax=Candidatus Ventrousia excrementavium TaxID=2840961 RepID=A0A9D1LKU0_9CLOT|nr:CBS domain-containing protein [Candidatus Ventrousia excrementavium]